MFIVSLRNSLVWVARCGREENGDHTIGLGKGGGADAPRPAHMTIPLGWGGPMPRAPLTYMTVCGFIVVLLHLTVLFAGICFARKLGETSCFSVVW